MRHSWLIWLAVWSSLLGSGPWLALKSAELIRVPWTREVCLAMQKPGIIYGMSDNGHCVKAVMWESWKETWECRLTNIGHSLPGIGVIGLCLTVWSFSSRSLNRRPKAEPLL